MDNTPKTKVMFRWWKDSVIAIFPEIASTVGNPYHCESYQHVGQHGGCDPQGIVFESRPAKSIEYKDLEEELMRIGYKLQIIHRLQAKFIDIRRDQLKG